MPKKRVLSVVAPTAPKVLGPVKKNHFVFVLDSSTSMDTLRTPTIKNFNDNVRAIREAAAAFGQETTVSLITFSDNVYVNYKLEPVTRLGELDFSTYRPSGNTALLDAVGAAVDICEGSPDARNPDASFVILALTDGEENRSTRFREGGRAGYSNYYAGNSNGKPSIKDFLENVQKTDRYTVAFLVPRGYGNALASQYGIPRGNIREWEQSVRGSEDASVATNSGVLSYYQSRSVGAKSVGNFYQTDLSTLKKSDLSKFDNLSANFKGLTVDKEMEIKPFIESHGKTFVLGASYYMLTKKEKLRTGRNVLVMEKGSKNVYGGAQARQILGIPSGEVTVTPGNHSNYDVYFQSTSVNRLLVRGTKLLYDVTKISNDTETWDSAAAKAAADAKKAAEAAKNV